jgi:large subunit ribosomal protein L14e
MLTVGRLCVKTAGRDAMEHCVIVEEIDEKYVLVDGNTRRKKVNKSHIEPLNKTIDIKKGATTKDVHTAFEKLGLPVKIRGEARSAKPQVKKEVAKKKEDKKTSKK